jgi:hypothetical protein
LLFLRVRRDIIDKTKAVLDKMFFQPWISIHARWVFFDILKKNKTKQNEAQYFFFIFFKLYKMLNITIIFSTLFVGGFMTQVKVYRNRQIVSTK